MLSRKGYSSHAVGKWHLGFLTAPYLPVSRGFETFLGFISSPQQDHFHHTDKGLFDFRLQQVDKQGGIQEEVLYEKKGQYSADIFTNRTVSLIKAHSAPNPLFVYLAYTNVHSPLQAPPEAEKQYAAHLHNASHRRKTLAAMASKVDEGIGKVVEALKEAGLYEDTVLVVSSDNGAPGCSNYPLRGHKRTAYEGGVRAVTFVHSPLLSVTGYVSKQVFHVVDWYTTFQRLGGNDIQQHGKDGVNQPMEDKQQHGEDGTKPPMEDLVKPQLELDGIDIWDAISSNATLSRDEVLLNYAPEDHCHGCPVNHILNENGFAIRRGKWKFLENVRRQDTRLDTRNCLSPATHVNSSNVTELYDLESDPREEVNVAATHWHVVETMRDRKAFYHDLTRPLYGTEMWELNVVNGTIFWPSQKVEL